MTQCMLLIIVKYMDLYGNLVVKWTNIIFLTDDNLQNVNLLTSGDKINDKYLR